MVGDRDCTEVVTELIAQLEAVTVLLVRQDWDEVWIGAVLCPTEADWPAGLEALRVRDVVVAGPAATAALLRAGRRVPPVQVGIIGDLLARGFPAI